MHEKENAKPVEIAADALSEEALAGLVEEFVTRDGTDYGAVEKSVDEKAANVRNQLRKGEARIFFDPETQSVNIVLARDVDPS